MKLCPTLNQNAIGAADAGVMRGEEFMSILAPFNDMVAQEALAARRTDAT
jgi:hypothetical protein